MIRLLRRLIGGDRWRLVARIPLTRPNSVQTSGMLYLHVRLRVWIENRNGILRTVDFLVDSGACLTAMSLAYAERINLPVPPPDSAIDMDLGLAGGTSSTQAMRPGIVRVRFSNDLAAPALNWPIRFMEGWPASARSLLGLNSLIGRFRWVFDGTPEPDAPWGVFRLFVLG